MKKERKPRWKELSDSERLARSCKQRGVSEEMCDHIRSRDKSPKKMTLWCLVELIVTTKRHL